MSNNTHRTAPIESFESKLNELESIVQQLESGQLTLELSLTTYQRGVVLLKSCQQSLDEVEQQVRILSASNQLESFTPDA